MSRFDRNPENLTENLDAALAASSSPLNTIPPAPPARLVRQAQSPASLANLEAEARQLNAELRGSLDGLEEQLAAPELRDLRDEPRRARERSARQEFERKFDRHRARLAEIRTELEDQAPHYTETAIRARLAWRFARDKAPEALALAELTRNAGPVELIELARIAAGEQQLDLAFAVERAAMPLDAAERAKVVALTRQARLPAAEIEAGETIARTLELIELLSIEAVAASSGRPVDLTAKLAVNFRASARRGADLPPAAA